MTRTAPNPAPDTAPEAPALCLTGAEVLTPGGLVARPLSLAGGRIVASGGRPVDLTGYRLLPGIVDLHGDGFERHMAPRRGALASLDAGLVALEAELAANGITTACLAQFFSWEGGMRGPDFAERLAEAVTGFRSALDLRLQLRLEISLADQYDRAEALVARFGIGCVVFNDHLPHKQLAAGKPVPSLTGQALKSGRSPQAHLALLQDLHARDPWPALTALAARLSARGVILGSHDDATPEARARFRALGARLAEFPETEAAAASARAAGDRIVMGAPNVNRGGSHKGMVPARTLLAAGHCDVLVSDYHYPAPATAALALVADGLMDLAQAWALISQAPAAALGLDDRGELIPGKRADLVALDARGRICLTLAAGRVAYLAGPLADRLLGQGAPG